MLHGDVVNQLQNQNGLADSRAAEQTDLAALDVWLHQVNDLDAGLKHFQRGGLIVQLRRGTVNRVIRFRIDWAKLIHRLA